MCLAADRTVSRFAQINAEPTLPELQLPDPTATDLDLCKVARATSTAALPNYGRATYAPNGFGLTCSVLSNNYAVTFEVGRADVYVQGLDKTTPVGSHTRLQASPNDTTHECDFAEIGPDIGHTGIYEEVDVNVRARVGSTTFCTGAAKLAGALLDQGGIK